MAEVVGPVEQRILDMVANEPLDPVIVNALAELARAIDDRTSRPSLTVISSGTRPPDAELMFST